LLSDDLRFQFEGFEFFELKGFRVISFAHRSSLSLG
jgi:hypothetical protein